MIIDINEEDFKSMIKRIEDQAHYIKELEKANDYKDKVIAELNKKYASKQGDNKNV